MEIRVDSLRLTQAETQSSSPALHNIVRILEHQNKWMNEWMDDWMKGWIDGQNNEYITQHSIKIMKENKSKLFEYFTECTCNVQDKVSKKQHGYFTSL